MIHKVGQIVASGRHSVVGVGNPAALIHVSINMVGKLGLALALPTVLPPFSPLTPPLLFALPGFV